MAATTAQSDSEVMFMAQPTDEQLKEYASKYKTVINVRDPSEGDFYKNEETLVKSLGMEYHNVPLKVT